MDPVRLAGELGHLAVQRVIVLLDEKHESTNDPMVVNETLGRVDPKKGTRSQFSR
jgi:hypothetical protein